MLEMVSGRTSLKSEPLTRQSAGFSVDPWNFLPRRRSPPPDPEEPLKTSVADGPTTHHYHSVRSGPTSETGDDPPTSKDFQEGLHGDLEG